MASWSNYGDLGFGMKVGQSLEQESTEMLIEEGVLARAHFLSD
jgi:hypothetical protein